MKLRNILGSWPLLLGSALATVAACSSSTSSGPTFDFAVVVEGSGHVRTSPAGIDCEGPADCGSHPFAASGTVTLISVPVDGQVVASVTLDGQSIEGSIGNIGIVSPASGTQRVVVRFAPFGSLPVSDGGVVDGGADAEAGTEASASVVCGAVTCGTGEQCCIDQSSVTCAKSCGTLPVAFCSRADSCGAGSVCCLRGSSSGGFGPTSLTCETEAACPTNGATGLPLCAPAGGASCGSGASCEPAAAGGNIVVCRQGG